MSILKRVLFLSLIHSLVIYGRGDRTEFPSRLCEYKVGNCNDMETLSLGDRCLKSEPCEEDSEYYTIDGSCNNLLHTVWGQARNGFLRKLTADYDDGIRSFRRGVDGTPLPNARVLANTLFPIETSLSHDYTVYFYTLGQWVTHDVSMIETLPIPGTCCEDFDPIPNLPEDCMPMLPLAEDPFYSQYEVKCLNETRAQSTINTGCEIKPSFIVNQVTSFLDLSILYSADKTVANSLREPYGGRLKSIRNSFNEEFPPMQNLCPVGGIDREINGPCMLTGDIRHNLNPEFTVMDMIFFRCHNSVADILHRINPSWEDEKLYQEARKILTAMYQNVVYKEWLPHLVGPDFMEKYELYPLPHNYATGYNPEINPGTDCHYSAGASRLPHSMILANVKYKTDSNTDTSYRLRDKFLNQRFLEQGETFKNLLTAYGKTHSEAEDIHHSEDIRNFLVDPFSPDLPFGKDLISIDILRSRDFALRSWNDVREACNLKPAENFDELNRYLINKETAETFKHLYKNVNDIDYYTAALCEKQLPGTISGPTAACIIGDAFYSWKFGDRLYYEFESAKFTLDQLQEIRKASFALFLCMANPQMEEIQVQPFLVPSQDNPSTSCDLIPIPDFTLWEDDAEK